MNLYNLSKLSGKLFNPVNFLITTGIYHIIAILFYLYGVKGFKLQTLVAVDDSLVSKSTGMLEVLSSGKGLISMLIICVIIIGIDLVFLLILSHDFRKLNLTWTKIYYIEAIIFTIALFVPVFRALLLFFSLNTLQVFVWYHLAKGLENYGTNIGSIIICLGGYVWLAKILIYPLKIIWSLQL